MWRIMKQGSWKIDWQEKGEDVWRGRIIRLINYPGLPPAPSEEGIIEIKRTGNSDNDN
jgi:hypothetical protein